MSLRDEMAEDAERSDKEVDGSDPSMSELVKLGDEMEEIRNDLDDLDAKKKELKQRYDRLRFTLIPDMMRNVGVVDNNDKGRFTIGSGSLLLLRTELHAGYRGVDKDKVFAWLRERDMGDVIKETVHHATFRSLAREFLQEGKTLPEFVTQYYETSVVLRRK
jgi:hypothetical protein